eukprot:TRINITY_DN123307_c0_g1_i1.p1 TRINITY_DN123307_c0_g1~~TRINITY_DN123307_c0_g1_i1.p1  ORF type:complete len:221 (-),score=26.88 TRINITY_DN123307_c0_g1_i1:857-1519(-)
MVQGKAHGKLQSCQESASSPKRSADAASLLAVTLHLLDQLGTIPDRDSTEPDTSAETPPVASWIDNVSVVRSLPVGPVTKTPARAPDASASKTKPFTTTSTPDNTGAGATSRARCSKKSLTDHVEQYLRAPALEQGQMAWPISEPGHFAFLSQPQLFDKTRHVMDLHMSMAKGAFEVAWQSMEFRRAVALSMKMPPPPGLEICSWNWLAVSHMDASILSV